MHGFTTFGYGAEYPPPPKHDAAQPRQTPEVWLASTLRGRVKAHVVRPGL
jgi:hypothetical protein